ncbi:iron transporter [Pseudoflavonifractor sp. MSJ-37]|uniref:iron transporter n=1 Tax=Pseudoflavonifractor sp. MSJ-37 TaxID=2841531 RepID=UPI003530254E
MKRIFVPMGSLLLASALLAGCGQTASPAVSTAPTASEAPAPTPSSSTEAALPDGVYEAKFDTDSSMFHVNEACEGKGTLTVADGKMTIHVSLTSKNIVNLFPGLAEDAQKDGAELLQPTVDTVTYSDGLSEEVNGFDVPVPALDQEFDLALLGKKGTWYDHKVSVSDPQPIQSEGKTAADLGLTDGSYTADIALEGGSGRASIQSPCAVTVAGDQVTATLIWSSDKYDYMLVDGVRYEPTTLEGGSTFEIPVAAFDTKLDVTADTTAMSTPHEVEYTIQLDSASLSPAA